MTRQTRKYVLGRAKLRDIGKGGLRQPSAERVYNTLASSGFAWDPATGWYQVDAVAASGLVSVRLIGAFADIVRYGATLGLQDARPPQPGDGGTWRLYGKVKLAPAPAQRRAERSAR